MIFLEPTFSQGGTSTHSENNEIAEVSSTAFHLDAPLGIRSLLVVEKTSLEVLFYRYGTYVCISDGGGVIVRYTILPMLSRIVEEDGALTAVLRCLILFYEAPKNRSDQSALRGGLARAPSHLWKLWHPSHSGCACMLM